MKTAFAVTIEITEIQNLYSGGDQCNTFFGRLLYSYWFHPFKAITSKIKTNETSFTQKLKFNQSADAK